MRLIDHALAGRIPESSEWTRENFPATSDSRGQSEYSIEVQSSLKPAVQRLNILLRHDGDIQVEYHIANKRGSPFELLVGLPEGEEAAAIEQVSLFVADLLAERLVLAYAKGLFSGGRRFIKPGSLLMEFASSQVRTTVG